jgi:hypothetical protein
VVGLGTEARGRDVLLEKARKWKEACQISGSRETDGSGCWRKPWDKDSALSDHSV